MKKIILSAVLMLVMTVSLIPMHTLAAAPTNGVDFIHDSSGNLLSGVSIKGGHKVAVTDDSGNTVSWVEDEENVPFRPSGPAGNAIDNKEGTQAIIYPAYFSYYQLDLGEIRPITKIRYLIPSDRDWYFKDAFKIELSNDPEFKDDVGVEGDVVTVYHFFTESKAEAFDEHIVDLGSVPMNYRYVRISRNDEPERDARGLAIAELDVSGYEYAASAPRLTDDATVTNAADGSMVIKLRQRSRVDKMSIDLDAGANITVTASNDEDFENAKTLFEGNADSGENEISPAFENTEGYCYLKITAADSELSINDVSIEGYPLFDLLADLYISDDGAMVYARARDGEGNILILAEYDAAGRFIKTVTANGTETVSLSVNEGSTYKAFLWTSLSERIPVTKSVRLMK